MLIIQGMQRLAERRAPKLALVPVPVTSGALSSKDGERLVR